MSESTQAQTQGSAPNVPQRMTIKIQNIPTEVLERLLKKYITSSNEKHKEKFGDVEAIREDAKLRGEVPEMELVPVVKKRTLADLKKEEKDFNLEIQDRIQYCNETLPKYGLNSDAESKYPEMKDSTTDAPMSSVFKVAVLEMMKTSIRNKFKEDKDFEIGVQESTLNLMTEWSSQFFHILSKRLQRLTEIQRRRVPSINDVKLLAQEGYFDNSGINDMYTNCQKWKSEGKLNSKDNSALKWKLVETMALAAKSVYEGTDKGMFNSFNEEVEEEEQFWIDKLVRRKKRKNYIPEWMPPLPPDYTYKSTPKLSEFSKDPVVLREKLVLEGRYGEKALDHIIIKSENPLCSPISEDSISSSDEENTDGKSLEPDAEDQHKESSDSTYLSSKEESSTSNVHLNEAEDSTKHDISEVTIPKDFVPKDEKSDDRLDIVELAKARMAILDARRKAEEERLSSRIDSEESELGRYFGFYTNIKKFPDNLKDELIEKRNNKLRDVVKNLHKQEKFNHKWLIEQEELRKKIAEEKSKYADANEITLGNGSVDEAPFYENLDEEVDFEVEFSDIEDMDNDQANGDEDDTKISVNHEGDEKVTDSDSHAGLKKEKEVRFEDQVSSEPAEVGTISSNNTPVAVADDSLDLEDFEDAELVSFDEKADESDATQNASSVAKSEQTVSSNAIEENGDDIDEDMDVDMELFED